jgi:hypothetical protein
MSLHGDSGPRTTDADTQALVVSATLKGQRGKGGGGIGPEETLVPEHYYVEDHEDGTLRSNGEGGSRTDRQPLVVAPAQEEAATLTKGSSSEGVSYPGRRKEDDENLVVIDGEEPQTFDWQVSGGGTSFRGKGRTWIEDKPGTARALTTNKTLAVHVPGEPVAFQQTPQGDLLEDPDGAVPPLLGREAKGVGNNSPLIAEPQAFNWEGDDPGNTPAGETPPLGAGHAGSIAVGFIPATGEGAGTVGAEDEVAPTLASVEAGSSRAAAVYTKTHGATSTEDHELWDTAEESRTLNGMGYSVDVVVEDDEPTAAPAPKPRAGAAVRRLTPRECERLQGLPDDWTLLEPGTPDGPRYAAIGDAVTVNVPRWIAARLVKRES